MTARSVRLLDHKDEIEKMYFGQGLSYQEIANHYGKSREAVRQFLNRYFPERISGKEFRSKLNQQRRNHVRKLIEERKAEPTGKCVICFGPVFLNYGGPHAKARTCSPEHAQLWVTARYILDPSSRKRQRISTAKSILKNKDRYAEASVRWANRVLKEGMPPKRSYRINNSKASAAYDEILKIRAKIKKTQEEEEE